MKVLLVRTNPFTIHIRPVPRWGDWATFKHFFNTADDCRSAFQSLCLMTLRYLNSSTPPFRLLGTNRLQTAWGILAIEFKSTASLGTDLMYLMDWHYCAYCIESFCTIFEHSKCFLLLIHSFIHTSAFNLTFTSPVDATLQIRFQYLTQEPVDRRSHHSNY